MADTSVVLKHIQQMSCWLNAHTHTHTVHTHLHLPQLKENTDIFFRTTHALSTVLPLQYIKYLHWEVNITHSYSIYVSAYCGRQSHYDTVCPPPPKKNQALQIPIALLISLKLTIHTSLALHTTHQSVGSKTTADVQYMFSVEPDILLTKDMVVVQFSHQVFDSAIPHIHL